jgi:type IV pilus assembly protein PilW
MAPKEFQMTAVFPCFPVRVARGFTLAEFMVAMTLGLLLISGVIHVYVASFSSWRVNDDLARLQENGRIAIGMLERDLRMAAFRGCAREDEGALSNALTTAAQAEWENGFWISGSSTAPVLTFRTPREGILKLSASVTAGSKELVLENNTASQAILSEDFFMVGHCGKSELFNDGAVGTASGTIKVNRTGAFANAYDRNDSGVQVLALARNFYTHEYDTDEKAWVLKRNKEVLAANVEVFRICYAEESGGKLTAPYQQVDFTKLGAINWNKVGSLQINLLLAAEATTAAIDRNAAAQSANALVTELCDDDGSVPWASGAAPQDTKLRKLFSTTIHLRNKPL